jgi:hypothetical protein
MVVQAPNMMGAINKKSLDLADMHILLSYFAEKALLVASSSCTVLYRDNTPAGYCKNTNNVPCRHFPAPALHIPAAWVAPQ